MKLCEVVPSLEEEWDLENTELFKNINKGASKKYGWVCKKCSHKWQASPNNRTKKKPTGCPKCSAAANAYSLTIPTEENSLAKKFPRLKVEYSDKNSRKFEDLCVGSGYKAIWICFSHGEYKSVVNTRTGRQACGCPSCGGLRSGKAKATPTGDNSLAKKFPYLRGEYSPKNDKKFEALCSSSSYRAIWVCLSHGEWLSTVNSRTGKKPTGCPECGKLEGIRKRMVPTKENSLAKNFPHLKVEYSPKNNKKFEDLCANSNYKAIWVCSIHGEYNSVVHSRTKGQCGCYICGRLKIGKARATPTEENSLAKNFPRLREEYSPKNDKKFEDLCSGADYHAIWVCAKHGDYNSYIYSRTGKQKAGCPKCSHTADTKLEQALRELTGAEIWNKMVFSTSEELPYRPDAKLTDTIFMNADGLRWHSEAIQKDCRHHFKTREAFEAKGLRLLQFYEDEIYNKGLIIKSMVDAIMGRITNKIFARKCLIKPVLKEEADNFLEANHLIGAVPFSKFIGLYNQDSLWQIMAYRLENDGTAVITRSAGLINTVVVGGFQRLLSKIPTTTIKTQIDLRYADGHSLEKAGFVRTEKPQLNYEYTNFYTREDKRKHRVPAGTNEVETAAARGWYRIWNAGRATYVLNKPCQPLISLT